MRVVGTTDPAIAEASDLCGPVAFAVLVLAPALLDVELLDSAASLGEGMYDLDDSTVM